MDNPKISKLPNILTSRIFLFGLSGIFIVISIFLWKTDESNNLYQLNMNTQSTVIASASEAEFRYRGIQRALGRLVDKGLPETDRESAVWEIDVLFLVESFEGLEHIALADKELNIYSIVPMIDPRMSIDKTAEIDITDSERLLWTPLYKGVQLEGFVIGMIDLSAFCRFLINDLEREYRIKIADENKTVYISRTWSDEHQELLASRSFSLQDTANLTLSIYPSGKTIQDVINNSYKILVTGIIFTILMSVTVFYSQRFYKLSRLNLMQFRKLLENAELLAVILDIDGNIIFCNDFLLDITGYKSEEVLGKNWFNMFISSDSKKLHEIFINSVNHGNLTAHYENMINTKSGRQRWVLFNNTLMYNTRGDITGVASLGEDITERINAEQALRESEMRYRKIISEAQGVAYEYDWHNDRYSFIESDIETFLGYSTDEITPSMMNNLVLKRENIRGDANPSGVEKAEDTGIGLPYKRADLLLKKKNGSEIWMMDCPFHIRDEKGEIVRTIGMLQDINERKENIEQLLFAYADKETLLQELYHRTKNNMQVVIGLIELQSAHFEDEKIREIFQETKNRILSMSMVHQKLYESQNLSSIDLAEYIIELSDALLNSYLVKPERISMVYDLDSFPMLIDTAVPCGLIINELLTNAIKYAFPLTEKGTIKINLKSSGGNNFRLQISDDGLGFPVGMDPRKSKSMGLRIVFDLAESQLKGDIDCISDNGVTWTFNFYGANQQPRV